MTGPVLNLAPAPVGMSALAAPPRDHSGRGRGRKCHDRDHPHFELIERRISSCIPFCRATLDELRGVPDDDGLCRRAIKRWREAGCLTIEHRTDNTVWWKCIPPEARTGTPMPPAPRRAGSGARAGKRALAIFGAYALPNAEIVITEADVPGAILLARAPRETLVAEISRRAPRAFDSNAFTVPGTLYTKDKAAIRRASEVFSWFLSRVVAQRIEVPPTTILPTPAKSPRRSAMPKAA